jgi:hypothetical protein
MIFGQALVSRNKSMNAQFPGYMAAASAGLPSARKWGQALQLADPARRPKSHFILLAVDNCANIMYILL